MSRRAPPLEGHLKPLDPTLDIPLRVQTERQMRDLIARDEWRSAERIPPERTLVQMLGISRSTLRQAVDALIHEGLLERRHGSGTYVSTPRYDQPLDNVYSFYEQFEKAGTPMEDTLVAALELEAGPTLARLLSIETGDLVLFLQRLRAARGVPLMVNQSYLPAALCPGLLTERGFPSLYALLRERYGLTIERADNSLEAVGADPAMADLLQVKPRTPLMLVERRAFTRGPDHGLRAIHYGRNFIRGDMVRFHTRLTSLELVMGKPGAF